MRLARHRRVRAAVVVRRTLVAAAARADGAAEEAVGEPELLHAVVGDAVAVFGAPAKSLGELENPLVAAPA